ncbi:hypothetical protein QL285_019959 [Trifolium repens]|nr:hypothetical protein QL285_019959 [Trifolium repens]
MHAFSIPWPCLDASSSPPKQPNPPSNNLKNQKSFAQALTNVCDIPASQLPQPCVKGDRLAISIPDEEYLVGLNVCKHNLHGRVVWPKGSTPLTVVALKNKLTPIWTDLAHWGITSLGKGFYEFSFSSLEDVRRVRSVASWNLEPGFLKLFAWTSDFNPNLQKNTTAQVWVRLYGLAQEYWRPKIIFAIASSIGTPKCTDAIVAKPMFERTFGQYARVLVDMDVSQPIRSKVLVERTGFAFFVDLDYENLPPFCSHCKMVGHYLEVCKRYNGTEEEVQPKEPKNKSKNKNEGTMKYVQAKDGRTEKNKATEVITVDDSAGSKIPEAIEGSLINKADGTQHASPVLDMAIGATTPIGSHNRFNALTGEGEEDDMDELLTDKNQQHSDNNDANSSTQEFVDATQLIADELPLAAELVLLGPTKDVGQLRIQDDMQFLKDSWANMAENEDDEATLLATMDKGPSPSGFQMAVSKASNRSKAGKSSSQQGRYGTRSKVIQPRTSR